MIDRLSVKDFILVDSLSLEFTRGFNVLTGETGAGKSILVGALSVLFGAKGGNDLVRAGAEESLVAGEFIVGDHAAARAWLEDHGITPEDGSILIRRTIRNGGRGTIYIGATPVTRSELEEFTSLLLDLHSQHEHQSLFSEQHHRRLLDRFGGIEEDAERFHETFQRLSDLQVRYRELQERQASRDRDLEMLRFAVEEIDAAEVKPGEIGELEAERDRMVQFERLAEHIRVITEALEESEYSLLPVLKRLRQEFSASARIDPSLETDSGRFESLYFELEDIAQNVNDYRDALRYDPVRLEEIEDRLALLKQLSRKYGDSEEEILAYAEDARTKLDDLIHVDESRDAILGEIGVLEQEVSRAARELHGKRVDAANTLKEKIEGVLRDLAMGRARFEIEIDTRSNERGKLVCGPYGADKVRFLISTNAGVSPQPLVKVASGGELSRVMLAIKTIIADVDEVRSLVFDEIDTGIGGQVALAIASHMRKLADHSQVIAITHLATLAVRADNHIVVVKGSSPEATRISAQRVDGEERVKEIARMLAGEQDETAGVEHARTLLERYQRVSDGQDQ
ncbi:MAG: DNA repair protein RecN [Alkalispirochaeta sp.]